MLKFPESLTASIHTSVRKVILDRTNLEESKSVSKHSVSIIWQTLKIQGLQEG